MLASNKLTNVYGISSLKCSKEAVGGKAYKIKYFLCSVPVSYPVFNTGISQAGLSLRIINSVV